MRTALLLTRRNLRLFMRDPGAVFFSFLSPLILLGLYALFLGSLQVDNLVEQLPNAPVEDIHGFVNAWVFAGTAMIATLTTGLAALTVFVDDSASGRFKDFLVSPVRRWELVVGYLAASFIIAFVMSMIVVAAGQLFLLTQGQATMSSSDWLRTTGYIALSAAAFSAISSFVVTFLNSSGGFSALSTVVGTLIGFLAGAYIPPGALPTAVVNIMNSLPFAQSAMLLRGPIVGDAAIQLADGSEVAQSAIDEFYGVTIAIGELTITPLMATLALAAVALVFTLLGIMRIRRKIR